MATFKKHNPNLYHGYDFSLHQAQLLVGEPKALAYEWIEQYAKSLSREAPLDADKNDEDFYYNYGTVNAHELIDTACANIDMKKGDWKKFITKGPLLEGLYVDRVFWDKLAIFLGIDIPQEKREDFFSCSC